MNAVLLKELRSMLRERRGFAVPMVYAAVLAAAVYLFFIPFSTHGDAAELGSVVAGLIAVMQTIAVLFIAPLVGATAVAGERERSTWLPLLASPVSRFGITFGKAAASSLYVLLLLCVSLPIAALSLLFGGADLAALAGLYLTHAILGVSLVCLGLAVSTAFERTWTAALVAVAVALGLAVFSIAVFAAIGGFDGREHDAVRWVLYLNPGYGLYLFFEGDRDVASYSQWLWHYAAMGTIGLWSLSVAALRLQSMKD